MPEPMTPSLRHPIRLSRLVAVAAGALLAACQPAPAPSPPPVAKAPAPPPAKAEAGPVAPAKRDLAALAPAPLPGVRPALPSTDLPPGPIYFCETAGGRNPMALPEGTESLCRRHPEMGPCKYERSACRARGGRVYTSKGEEVTAAVEAAYDQRVMRVRLQADGGPAKR